jgi:hypothetical protein
MNRAIRFPDTPEHPVSVNQELQYRLDFLRVLDRTAREAEKVQEHLGRTTAWSRASAWVHETLIRAARESIDALGPLSDHAQKAELRDFVKSLNRE